MLPGPDPNPLKREVSLGFGSHLEHVQSRVMLFGDIMNNIAADKVSSSNWGLNEYWSKSSEK